jgi:AcrR family transcriptional regulator
VTPRRRLAPDERRSQLLDVGAQLFAALPYEQVLMEEVAARAGVSRALLYRHFPSKRDLFAAVYRRAADRLLDATELDPAIPLAQQVAAGLDTHIDYFVANRNAVLAANRTLVGDPVIQTIITDELAELRRRVIDVTRLDGRARDVLSTVMTSWLVFVRVLCVDWLANPILSREEVRDICVRALLAALGDVAVTADRIREEGQHGESRRATAPSSRT